MNQNLNSFTITTLLPGNRIANACQRTGGGGRSISNERWFIFAHVPRNRTIQGVALANTVTDRHSGGGLLDLLNEKPKLLNFAGISSSAAAVYYRNINSRIQIPWPNYCLWITGLGRLCLGVCCRWCVGGHVPSRKLCEGARHNFPAADKLCFCGGEYKHGQFIVNIIESPPVAMIISHIGWTDLSIKGRYIIHPHHSSVLYSPQIIYTGNLLESLRI